MPTQFQKPFQAFYYLQYMVRGFLFFVLIIATSSAWSQRVLLIEKNKSTAELFDDETPYSLFSLLQSNIGLLGYYDLDGMSLDKVARLREAGLSESVKRFVFPNSSDVPLVGVNGEDSVEIIDGMYFYVYPPTDTIYGDITDITRITLEFDDDGREWEDLSRFNCWKKYPGDEHYTRTFSSEAKELFKMDAFKQFVPVKNDLVEKITDLDNPSSMWSLMKDSALVEMKHINDLSDSIGDDFVWHNQPIILPNTSSFYWHRVGLRLSKLVYNASMLKGINTYCEDDDQISYLPFLVRDSAKYLGTPANLLVIPELNTNLVNFIQSDMPLLDEDPDSPNFGYELIVIDENGQESFVFPVPEPYYTWVDYDNPQIYVLEDINSTESLSLTRIESVFMTKQIGEGKPTLIAYVDCTDDLQPYFYEHEITFINHERWFRILRKAVKSKKGHFNLAKKCQLRKYKKRFH